MTKYQICTNCIMDTSDRAIRFDDQGVCDYCTNFNENILPNWKTDGVARRQLDQLVAQIQQAGKGKDFDCIIGLSGGLDSSYCAYVSKELLGLRPLLVHVDAGWNTDQAVENIERLVDGLGIELFTEVIDWEAMKDLQVAFLKAQVPDQDLPQDAAFFSGLYKFARKFGIKYVLTGGNYSTECCREPEAWGAYPGIDTLFVRDVLRRFGKHPNQSIPLVDTLEYRILYRMLYGMRVVKPLNSVPYIKREAESLLAQKYGWRPFKHKHHESRFTRFYEDYWLPRKFGFEKRRAHLSSLIMTGQLTRDEAIQRIANPEMDAQFHKHEFEYVANKLDLSVDELQALFDGENRTYLHYRNKRWIYGIGTWILQYFGLENRQFR